MRMFLHALLILSLVMPLAACANKGRLKSPSEIAAEEIKKAAKKPAVQEESDDDDDESDGDDD